MGRPFLQSTLREIQLILRSPRFWTTFAAVVLIFWITGPYGTSEQLALAPRLGFWLVMHAIAWSIAIVFVVAAELLLANHIPSALARMLTGAVVAAPPIGIATSVIASATFGTPITIFRLAESIASGLLLSVLFCVLTWMTMTAEAKRAISNQLAPAFAPQVFEATGIRDTRARAGAPAPILQRLRPERRGQLLHLTVEDHYTAVTTARGRELVLLRFSDAIKEVGDASGLQVHRSHWVADMHVDRLVRTDGRLALVLKDGQLIPVSRTYADAVRARYN